MSFQPEFPLYGVEQSNHGHLYRWIFKETDILEQTDLTSEKLKEEPWTDIGWPIGGSNSSATSILVLSNLEEVKGFLLSEYETDLDDPMLVDIAEGIYTIDTDDEYHHSITSQFVTLFDIPESELTKQNSLYPVVEDLIQQIKELDSDNSSEIDYDNPFYGESECMRISEIKSLLASYQAIKSGFYVEILNEQQKRKVLEFLEEKGYHWATGESPVNYGMEQILDFIYVSPLSDCLLRYDSKTLLKLFHNLEKPDDAPIINGYDFLREPEFYFSKMQQPTEHLVM